MGVTPSSSLIRTHAPNQNTPINFVYLVQWVFAGCRHSLLRVGPSQRYLRESFPRCLSPYPGGSQGARARCFPCDIGLPRLISRSARHQIPVQRLPYGRNSRGCSDSLMFRPPGLLTTPVAPTATYFEYIGQPWFLHPSISRFVTSPRIGYASRPNRAIDGVGTCTPLDSRPCWPLR